jgi:hypothetical protein
MSTETFQTYIDTPLASVLIDDMPLLRKAKELGYEGFCEYIRSKRSTLLSKTDWTANSDVTMTAEMTTYRQALRDVPAQSGFPDAITWPQEPSI